jgi:hypothetical protein
MGKVVLIEPHKVLQQAIALSLFPEHDVQVKEAVSPSDISAFGDADLLIVDAAALRENNHFSPELSRAIESAAIPTVWIDDDESARPAEREKLAVVMKPIESAAFQAALAQLLSAPGAGNERKKSAPPAERKTEKAKATEKKPGGKAEPDLIELVDAVEEDSDQRPSPAKPK